MLSALMFLLAQAAPEDKAAEDALDAFKTAFKSTSEADRSAAVQELAKVAHAKVTARLSALLGVDGPTVRIAAAKGLVTAADPRKAAAALVQGFGINAREPGVQAAILAALAKVGDPSALPLVHRAFDEKDAGVAKAAVQASGEIRHASSVDPLLALLSKLDRIPRGGGAIDVTLPDGTTVNAAPDEALRRRADELRPAVLKALESITRQSITSAADFHAWWARNKSTFKVAPK